MTAETVAILRQDLIPGPYQPMGGWAHAIPTEKRDAIVALLREVERQSTTTREQVAQEIEADAELTERAAEGWRVSERDPNNTTAGADFDRINAEHRESFAKNLRALATRVRHGGEL